MGRLHGASTFALATQNPAILPKLTKGNVGKRNKHNDSNLSLRMHESIKQMTPMANKSTHLNYFKSIYYLVRILTKASLFRVRISRRVALEYNEVSQ